MGRFSSKYIDELIAGNDYLQLVEISSIICASTNYSRDAPNRGLPTIAFMYVEALFWFAQATRSGVWTYYEATPPLRQEAMLLALNEHGPLGFADWYKIGMQSWRDEMKIVEVDKWIEANDEAANQWLRNLLIVNREMVSQLTA